MVARVVVDLSLIGCFVYLSATVYKYDVPMTEAGVDRLFLGGLMLLVLPSFASALIGPLWILAVMGIGYACAIGGLLLPGRSTANRAPKNRI
jgi:uncharacterized membrane protein